jgi:hypothetical protein
VFRRTGTRSAEERKIIISFVHTRTFCFLWDQSRHIAFLFFAVFTNVIRTVPVKVNFYIRHIGNQNVLSENRIFRSNVCYHLLPTSPKEDYHCLLYGDITPHIVISEVHWQWEVSQLSNILNKRKSFTSRRLNRTKFTYSDEKG